MLIRSAIRLKDTKSPQFPSRRGLKKVKSQPAILVLLKNKFLIQVITENEKKPPARACVRTCAQNFFTPFTLSFQVTTWEIRPKSA